MKKKFKYFYILIIVSFINLLNCNAECSYQERKDLLNDAKNVNIYYEIEETKTIETGVNSFGEEVSIPDINYIFNFSVVGLTDKMFISYKDRESNEKYITYDMLNNGIYTFKDDNFKDIYSYEFIFHSNNENCIGRKITTRKITKPRYNGYNAFSICHHENMENYKYCQKFITNDFNITEGEFFDKANEYLNTFKVEENNKFNLKEFFYDYYIYIVCGFIIIIGSVSYIVIRKKRSRL